MKFKKYKTSKRLILILSIIVAFNFNLRSQCVEQSFTNGSSNYLYNDATGFARIGEKFTVGCSGNLTELRLKSGNNLAIQGTLSVYSGTSLTTGTLIATQAFTGNSGSIGEYTISLSSPPLLTIGNTYIFLFLPDYNFSFQILGSPNYYPNGIQYIQNSSGTFESPTRDVYFMATIAPTCTPKRSTTNIAVCPNQLPINWNGKIFSTAKTDSVYFPMAPGCDSIATLNLSVFTNTISTVSTSKTNICLGDTVQLSATGTGTLTWEPAGDMTSNTGNTVSVYPGTTTTFTVSATDANCTLTNTITINVAKLVDVNVPMAAVDTVVCTVADSTSIEVYSSQEGCTYYLENSLGQPISAPQYGGGNLSFPTGSIGTSVDTFKIHVVNITPDKNGLLFSNIYRVYSFYYFT